MRARKERGEERDKEKGENREGRGEKGEGREERREMGEREEGRGKRGEGREKKIKTNAIDFIAPRNMSHM